MSGAVAPDSVLSDRYVIERELGRGGMGVVFLARDLRHERTVALKFLPAELAGAVGAARFDQEIRTLARLSHPHILPLHDSGATDGELFYVMPHIEGESLRERLVRAGPLRLVDALRIARQVADALAYAHARGVVHRDIKPENILLDQQGHAWVADFGIARVLAGADSSRLTSVSLLLGSPAYMSPEQVAGERELDGRSDIYSLGCVLYEMLAGEPPFPDSSAHVVMRRHLMDPPPSVRDRRADVGSGVDELLGALLAKSPEERAPAAETLVAVLDAELVRITGEGTAPRLLRPRERRLRRLATTAALALIAVVALVWGVAANVTGSGFLAGAAPDSTRWVVLPLQWQEGSRPSPDRREDLLLHAAFARWRDLDIVSRAQVAEEAGRRTLGMSGGMAVARDLGAGRFVHGLATVVGDSVQIELTLADVLNGRALRRSAVRIAQAGFDPHRVELLVDSLLFGRVTWDAGPEASIGTRSAAARSAYSAGWRALDAWSMADADRHLSAALRADPGFARAHLWLAQLRSWTGAEPGAWREHATAAVLDTADLTPRERLLADALALLGTGDYPRACAAYERVVQRDARDFAGWFGLGACRDQDDLVVRDPRSRSGWSFRGSMHTAVGAYERALTSAAESQRLFRDEGYARLRELLLTGSRASRTGVSSGGVTFAARAEWRGDSLDLTPFEWEPGTPLPRRDELLHAEAQRRQRLQFLRIAEAWVARDPHGADALLALAVAQDLIGDAAAIETIERARLNARTPDDRRALDLRAVWLALKFGAGDTTRLAAARALADSMLGDGRLGADAGSALAILLGRPAHAAAISRRAVPVVDDVTRLPASLTRPAAALIAFASVGAPSDSIARLEAEVENVIAHGLAPDLEVAALADLERAVLLSASSSSFEVLQRDLAYQTPAARAWAAVAQGDTVLARRHAREFLNRFPRGVPAGRVTLDVLHSEAALLVAIGDTAGAISWLDPTLDGLQWVEPDALDEAPNAGALVRAMALRAQLASARDEVAVARLWAAAVVTLWATGDSSVEPVLTRMRSILAQ